MKRTIIALIVLLAFAATGFAASTKITALPADTSPTSDDLIPTVNDPGGTPAGKKVTLGNAVTKAHGLTGGAGALVELNSSNVLTTASPLPFANIKDYGALCDEKLYADGISTSASTTFTSASANFVSGDVGKAIIITGAGAQLSAPSAPTITNGGTGGSTTYTYTVTAITPTGETTASSTGSTTTGNATLSFTNYNIITWTAISGATGYKIYRTVGGATQGCITTYPIAPFSFDTSRVFNDHGAAASGSSPGSNTAYGPLLTTISARGSATSITLGNAAGRSVGGLRFAYGTDDSTALVSVLTDLYNSGDGTLVLPNQACVIVSQITLPNDGGAYTTDRPMQPYIRITGSAGGPADGFWKSLGSVGQKMGSALDLWSDAVPAKIVTMGTGKLEFDHMTFMDRGSSSNAFVYTNNTSVAVHDVTVSGSNPTPLSSPYSPTNDFIILGGTKDNGGGGGCGDIDCAFQGYGTYYDHNWFSEIRRIAVHNYFANEIKATGNFTSQNNANWNGGYVEMYGKPSNGCYGNSYISNSWEVPGYKYVYNLFNAPFNRFVGDDVEDNIHPLTSIFGVDAGTYQNQIQPALYAGSPLITANSGNPIPYNGYNLVLDITQSNANWGGSSFPLGTTTPDPYFNNWCNSGFRGSQYYLQAPTGMPDMQFVCGKAADDTYGWRPVFAYRLGDELVTNGDFGSSTGWTVPADWAIGSGVATHTPGAAGTLYRSAGISQHGVYLVSVTVNSISVGSVRLSAAGNLGMARTSAGTFYEYLIGINTDSFLYIEESSDCDAVIDNASVKQVIPY